MDVQKSRRKRARSEVDGPNDSTDVPEAPVQNDAPATRDENYYRADGDCVIRVGDVLFKIHRYLLVGDSSVFADMFNLPQGNTAPTEMATDENPARLYDDVDDFRALCWFLYALPMTYLDQTDESNVDIPKIVSLFLIAHKYHLESHEKFARNILLSQRPNIYYGGNTPTRSYFLICPDSRLGSLLQIACLTEDSAPSTNDDGSLTTMIQDAWRVRLTHANTSISYPLGIAETLGLRKFIGQLYYFELTMRMDTSRIEGSTAYHRPTLDLIPSQKLALFEGSWSLQRYWSDLTTQAPLKIFNCPANRGHSCNELWNIFWPEYMAEIAGQPFDPVYFLDELANSVSKRQKLHELEGNVGCINLHIKDMIETLQNSRADHFLGPLPSTSTSS